MTQNTTTGRIDWVDYGKGICIILVVMMHSTLGVERTLGTESWLHGFIDWARPFRMPDFFLIAGLFLAARIKRPWRSYLDTKVVHFAYFYVLWLTISFALKGPGMVSSQGLEHTALSYLISFIDPLGTLWFIYMLGIFFVVAKLAERLPAWSVWLVAAVLEMAPVHTGYLVIDEFAGRFVYFYSGYVLAPWIFQFADMVRKASWAVVVNALTIWAVVNAWFVFNGYATLPVLSLALGFIGAAAVVAAAVMLTRMNILAGIRYCGAQSLVIYLSFFVFMAVSRAVLIKTGIITDAGLISLIVTAAGVIGPLVLHAMVRNTPAKYLFVRPAMFRLKPDAQAGGSKIATTG